METIKKCNKIPFDKVGAMFALAEIKARKKPRGEKRIYWCATCKAYHLTSKKKLR